MEDKIPVAVVILAGTLIVSVMAGWNDNLGKFLFAFMLIIGAIWLIQPGTQGALHRLGSKGGIFPTPSGKKPTQIGVL